MNPCASESYSHVPIKSLKYECLSKLAKMMRKPTESTIEDPPPYSPNSRSNNSLNLPIKVVQLIIDFVSSRWIPVRLQAICALLAERGCYSLVQMSRYQTNFCPDELKIILDILTKNAGNLRYLHFHQGTDDVLPVFPFKENSLIRLRCLRIRFITSFVDLIAIFAACPNLIELGEIDFKGDQQEVEPLFQEIQKPKYNQIHHSLRVLRVYGRTSEAIKLIALFTNLISLHCYIDHDLHDPVILFEELTYFKEAVNQQTEYSSPVLKDVSLLELGKVLSIFEQLRVLNYASSREPCILDLTPNLEVLHFFQECSNVQNLNEIANLKHLKNLSISCYLLIDSFSQMLLKILQQIGHNLEVLYLSVFSRLADDGPICIAIIARYCPNLERLHLYGNGDSFYMQSDISGLNLPDQERENLRRPFRHLKVLDINFVNDSNMLIFPYILGNAVNIERLEIHNCLIAEVLWTEVFQLNPLKNLRVLKMDRYNILSKSFLIRLTNSLDKLCYAKWEDMIR